MRIWTIHLGEQLPIDTQPRSFRNGMLAETAAKMGHEVVSWAPTFSHLEKVWRRRGDAMVELTPNWNLMLFECGGYGRNVSFGRARFHTRAARAFERLAPTLPRPDVIFCSLPTPGMASAAVRFAKMHPKTQVVIDIRDLWPDVYATLAPKSLVGFAKKVVRPLARLNRDPLTQANAITAVSKSYLQWAKSQIHDNPDQFQRVFMLGYRPASQSDEVAEPPPFTSALNRIEKARLPICYVGQFGHLYDLETIVKAVLLVERRGHEGVLLTLCGSGAQDKKLRELADGSKAVQFTGWIDAAQIGRVLRANKVGILSYTEAAPQSLPNKPFEYMAYGVALVSNLAGEMEEIMKKERCGFSFDAGDVEGLAHLLETLLKDPDEVARAGSEAARFFSESCNADQIYRELIEFLCKVAKTR